MTDTTIMNGLVSLLKTLQRFSKAEIVIDDYSILDETVHRSPYLILETPDDFESTQRTKIPVTVWNVPVTLFVRFTEWKDSLEEFRECRNELITLMNGTAGERSANQQSTTIDTIKNIGKIQPFYDPYLSEEQVKVAMPLFLFQTFLFIAQEY